MKKIDPIAHSLWRKHVQLYTKRSLKRTRAIRILLEAGPLPGNNNLVIRDIIKDGRGMDGFQAAMMTWSYLAALCRYHELKLQKKI